MDVCQKGRAEMNHCATCYCAKATRYRVQPEERLAQVRAVHAAARHGQKIAAVREAVYAFDLESLGPRARRLTDSAIRVLFGKAMKAGLK